LPVTSGSEQDNKITQTLQNFRICTFSFRKAYYNQGLEKSILTGKTVVGLENVDEVSKEFRPYKQLVERLNRTYKFRTRPRAGLKSLTGATSLTTLFVAYYNYLRGHGTLKHPPLIRDTLQGIERYPKQWETLLTMTAA